MDSIVNPAHYAQSCIQPIDLIMGSDMEFWRGNIIKYASRAGLKNDNPELLDDEAEIKDLKKVIRYAEMRINQLEGRGVRDDG